MIPKPTAIWADQQASIAEPSPFGCIDCPPNTQHEQIYLLQGTSFCYNHIQARKGNQIDNEFSS